MFNESRHENEASDLLRRLRAVLSHIDLDCACRAIFEAGRRIRRLDTMKGQ